MQFKKYLAVLAAASIGILPCGLIQAETFLTNGLVAYYPFNGNANDESGNTNNGIGYNVAFTSDRFGTPNSASLISGTDSYIIAAADHLPTTNRTVAVWFYSYNSTGTLLGYGGGTCGSSFFMVMNPSGQYELQAHCGVNRLLAPENDSINKWHHWVATIQGTSMTIYIDGTQVSTENAFSVATTVTNKDLIIGMCVNVNGKGNYADSYATPFSGVLDEVRVYNRALSTSEVEQLYRYESQSGQPTYLRVDMIKAAKPLFGNLTISTNYQLQISTDLNSWINQGPVFKATNVTMTYPGYFDTISWEKLFFRLQVIP